MSVGKTFDPFLYFIQYILYKYNKENNRDIKIFQGYCDPMAKLYSEDKHPAVLDLLKLQGEGDPTGGALILFTQTITVKNGDHYRVIPGNRTFGA